MLPEWCSIQPGCSIHPNSMALYGVVSQIHRICGFINQNMDVVLASFVITLSDLLGECVLHLSTNLASVGPDCLCWKDFPFL